MSNCEKFGATILKTEQVVPNDVQDRNHEQNEQKTPQKNGPSDDPTDHGPRNNKRERSNSEPTGLNISPNKSKDTKKAKTIRRTKSNSVTHMHYVKDGSNNQNNNLDSVQEGDGNSIIIGDGYSIEDEAVNQDDRSNETDLEARKEYLKKVEKNNDPNVHYEAGAGFVVAMKMNNVATVREGDDSSSANKDEAVWFTEAKANLRKARTSLNAVDHKLNKMEGLINGADGKPNNGRTTGVSLTRDAKLQVVGGAIETFLTNVQKLACDRDMFEDFTEDDVKPCLEWANNLKHAFDTVCKGEIPVTLMTNMITSSFGKVIDNNDEEHSIFDILADFQDTLNNFYSCSLEGLGLDPDDVNLPEVLNCLNKTINLLLRSAENTKAKSKGMTRRRRGRNCKFNIVPEDQMVQLFHSRNVVTICVRMMVSSKSKFLSQKC